MTGQHIHGNGAALSASSALDAIGSSLLAIKSATGLTDARLSDPLCKSPDRLRDYRESNSEMGAVTFLRAVATWGPSFGDVPLALARYRLCALADDGSDDRAAPRRLTTLLLGLSVALESNGDVNDSELRDNAEAIRDAGALIDELRARLNRVLAK